MRKKPFATRRSARVLDHDPIVAPGFGTRKDIDRLSAQLSSGNVNFPPEAVLEMMSVRGRGLRSRGGDAAADAADSKGVDAAAASTSPWADFMKEEGVSAEPKVAASQQGETGKGSASKKKAAASSTNEKSAKRSKTTSPSAGTLVQTGTLDSSVVGREKLKSSNKGDMEPYHLMVPTILLPSVKITRVFSGCNAVHSLALDTKGTLYGWGRNENGQLGSHLPANVSYPAPILEGADGPLASSTSAPVIASATMGKSHTLLLDSDGCVWAVGSNKVGQCGVQKAGDSVPHFRQCTLPAKVAMAQVRLQKRA